MKVLNKDKFVNRLSLGFGLLFVFLLGMGTCGIWGMIRISDSISVVTNEYITIEYSERLRADINKMRRYEKDLFLNIDSPKELEKYKRLYDETLELYNANFGKLMEMINEPYEHQLCKEIIEVWNVYLNGFYEVYEKTRRGEITDSIEANRRMIPYKTASHKADELADRLAASNVKIAKEALHKSGEIKKTVIAFVAVMMIILLATAALIGVFVTHSISQSHSVLQEHHDLIKSQNIELEALLSQVKQLEGIIPICSYCKKIRDDQQIWQRLETYISNHSEAMFSHGICPECFEEQKKQIGEV